MGTYGLTNRECMALRILAREGWSSAGLKMCFETTRKTVKKHIIGDCNHKSYVRPFRGWDGNKAKSERRHKGKAWEPYNVDLINESGRATE